MDRFELVEVLEGAPTSCVCLVREADPAGMLRSHPPHQYVVKVGGSTCSAQFDLYLRSVVPRKERSGVTRRIGARDGPLQLGSAQ